IVAFYAKVLRAVLERPLLVLGSSAVIIVAAYLCYSLLGTDLMPEMDEGGFILDYWTPSGSSLAESNRILLHIEEIVKSQPEVENTSRRTGMELGDRKSTRLNSSHRTISYAVFCLK